MNLETINYNKKLNLRKIFLISISILIIILLCLYAISFFHKSNNISNENANTNLNILEIIYKDYRNGTLTTDEYVKNVLYAEYDDDLLNEKYSHYQSSDLIHTDDLIDKYYDQLSEGTLRYYFDKINLKGITFELDKNNKDDDKIALSDIFIDKVYAKSDVTNLNKAILSENGNFIVWYTTTGSSATDYASAKKVADGLEKTISQYKKLFGYDYNFNSTIFSKGKTYKNQKKILENSNIDTSYLENAMQVYLVNYNHDSLAKYVGRSGELAKLWNKFFGGDDYGSVLYPYILIKPSSFNDFEKLEQLYNHELFHHYQHEVLCGHNECAMGSDPYIGEATANWASALVTSKTTNYGYLNEWAGTALSYADKLLSDEMIEKYGESSLGYALYVYLFNYSEIVNNGISKIINSINANDFLGYLIDSASKEELAEIQEQIALKNITQDYNNKNLNVDLNFNAKIPIRATISHKDKEYKSNNTYYNYLMSPISQNFYLINDNSNYAYQIHLERDYSESSKFISATIIKFYNGKYTIVESSKNSNESYTFNTNNYGDYDSLYIVISNTYPNRKNSHVLNIKEIKKESLTIEKDKNYISLINCDAYFDEEKEKQIDTYYFDENEKIYKWIVTTYWIDEETAKLNYENDLTNSNYENVNISGKIVSFKYTENAILNYFPNMTKESEKRLHDMSCSTNSIVDFIPNID